MSNKNDFNKMFDKLLGISEMPTEGSPESFAEYLRSIAVLGEASRLKDLVDRLFQLGMIDSDQVSSIMDKVRVLSEDAKEILEDYDNFDSEDVDAAGSDEVECDCDFCVLSEGLESGEDVNSIRSRLKKKHDEKELRDVLRTLQNLFTWSYCRR